MRVDGSEREREFASVGAGKKDARFSVTTNSFQLAVPHSPHTDTDVLLLVPRGGRSNRSTSALAGLLGYGDGGGRGAVEVGRVCIEHVCAVVLVVTLILVLCRVGRRRVPLVCGAALLSLFTPSPLLFTTTTTTTRPWRGGQMIESTGDGGERGGWTW